jgi:hypothetical protein
VIAPDDRKDTALVGTFAAMALFRHRKAIPVPPPANPISHSPSQTAVGPAGAPDSSTWLERELVQGQRAREAIERDDVRSAGHAWKNRQEAKAKARGYPTDDGFVGFNAEAVRDTATVGEVGELGLLPERGQEFRIVLALDRALDLKAGDGVLAVLLGSSLPSWPQFWRERDQWRGGTFRPDMWPAVLLDTEPDVSWQPAALTVLNFDARQVLAYPKLVRRRSAVTRQFLAERTLLPFDRLDHAIDELHNVGLAQVPTLTDRLDTLTAVQLKQAHTALGLTSKGAKPALVAALTSLDDTRVHAYLADHHPDTLEPELTVGVGAGKAADWFVAYATLMAHWFTVGLLPARQVQDGGTAGWEIYKTDNCPVCRKAPSRVPRNRPHELPPFHIGCRCAS